MVAPRLEHRGRAETLSLVSDALDPPSPFGLSGGYTRGSISVLAKTEEGIASIAGDIAHHIDD